MAQALRQGKRHTIGIVVPQLHLAISLGILQVIESKAGMLKTPMTSLEIPANEMGEKAALMIIKDIEAPSDNKPSPTHLVFTSTLVDR